MPKPDPQFVRLIVLVNGFVPAAMLSLDAIQGRLGANPIEFVTGTTGLLTLIFLLLSLAVTPVRKVTGLQWLAPHRRTLGLYAFFYGCLHLMTYVWFDKFFNLRRIAGDTLRRPFLLVGMLSFALMVPLAVTSTNAMIKRLGGKRWRRLHRLAYVVAAGGVLHFLLLVKAQIRKPLMFGFVLAILLGYRVYAAYGPRLRQRLTLREQEPPS